MATLTNINWKALRKRPGRHRAGDGMSLVVKDNAYGYWTYRFTIDGQGREVSLGSAHKIDYAEARAKHLELRHRVEIDKVDPTAEKRAAKATRASSDVPTSGARSFGEAADAYLRRQEDLGQLGKNPKHREQWRATLAALPAWFRALPTTEITPQHVFAALDPIWRRTPETGSRLRGRMNTVLDDARAYDDDRANPAQWTDWLKRKLGSAVKLGKIDRGSGQRVPRGHHAAMPSADLPAFMARLKTTEGVAAKALAFTILTASRTGETLGMRFEEIDFDAAIWTVPAERMKMKRPHVVPLSAAALDILKTQLADRTASMSGLHPYVFPSTLPRRPLSDMSMAMTMRRLGIGKYTVHGFRSSARSWMADHGVEFEVAESCLAHTVGNAVVQAYQRSAMVERRRPVMHCWAQYLMAEPAEIVPFPERRPGGASRQF